MCKKTGEKKIIFIDLSRVLGLGYEPQVLVNMTTPLIHFIYAIFIDKNRFGHYFMNKSHSHKK